MSERLIFVDENDQPIGVGPREEAWEKGYYTRNIRIILRDEHNRFLAQKRSTLKKTYPGMWTAAAGGHVDDGEDWETAAKRETLEEIGVSTELTFVGGFTLIDDSSEKKVRQIIRVYEATIDSSTPFIPQEEEVEEIKWFELDALKNEIAASPEQFTPSLIETIEKFYS